MRRILMGTTLAAALVIGAGCEDSVDRELGQGGIEEYPGAEPEAVGGAAREGQPLEQEEPLRQEDPEPGPPYGQGTVNPRGYGEGEPDTGAVPGGRYQPPQDPQ